MARSSTTARAKGFNDNPAGKRLRAKSLIEMLDRIGDEKVRAPAVPADEPGALLITRRELLERVLWMRAPKLIIEYLDGKPGETEGAPGKTPAFHATDLALAEALLREGLGNVGHGEGETGRKGDGEGLGNEQPDVP